MYHKLYKITILFILFTFVNCGDSSKNYESNNNEETSQKDDRIQITTGQFEQSNMTLGKIQEREFPTIVKCEGIIDVPPENKAKIYTALGGYVKTSPLLVGDFVKKGNPLLTIENPEFVKIQQEYLTISEQLNYLKSEFERQKIMFEENITSKKQYSKAEVDFNMASASFKGLRKQLELLNISPKNVEDGHLTSIITLYAPISGSISQINISLGSFVSPTTEILEIIDNDHIHLELFVFEKDILKIKIGQQITFKIPETTDANFLGSVHLVGTDIDSKRSITVHGHIEDNLDQNFLTGMYVDAAITTNSKKMLSVPNEAIVTIDNRSFLLVLEQKKNETFFFKQVEILIENSNEDYSAIKTDEINSSVQLLTSGAFQLIGE